jgi:hypothetical protein
MILQKIRLHEIKKTAELFDIPLKKAIQWRRDYLWLEFLYYRDQCEEWDVIAIPSMIEVLNEMYALKKDIFFRMSAKKEDITPEMIAQAKLYPISKLIEIDRFNKICCLIHEEKTPSMNYNVQRNKLHCFGCGANMDSIDVYMRLNNTNFHKSVQALYNQS